MEKSRYFFRDSSSRDASDDGEISKRYSQVEAAESRTVRRTDENVVIRPDRWYLPHH